jgi:DNA-binding NtrC family response regulator
MEDVRAMATSHSHLLILGESGAGKTELAHEIHRMSPRRSGPFSQVDLAAEPAELVSASLFGHEKGAFTGALQAKEGYIAAAHGGTLFLDEIGDIRPDVQQKLLLFLQSKTYRPVGSTRERTADVRILLATNKNLEEEIASGRFRRDLYYRLAGLTLTVPSLRERREDIPYYCEHFFELFCRREGRRLQGITPAAMAALVSQAWPGNLRDLQNCLQRAVLLAPEGGWIEPGHLSIGGGGAAAGQAAAPGASGLTLTEAREELDRRMLTEALATEGYNRSRAARRLGITRQGLLGMMRRYGIDG